MATRSSAAGPVDQRTIEFERDACIDHLRGNDQGVAHFSIALRARNLIAILIGAGFILFGQTLENRGQLLNLAPWFVGGLPTAMLAALSGALLWRAR